MEIKSYRSEEYGVTAYDMADVILWNMLQELRKKWSMISSTEYIISYPFGYINLLEVDSYYDLYINRELIQKRIDNIDEATEIVFEHLEKIRHDTVEMRNFFRSLDK